MQYITRGACKICDFETVNAAMLNSVGHFCSSEIAKRMAGKSLLSMAGNRTTAEELLESGICL